MISSNTSYSALLKTYIIPKSAWSLEFAPPTNPRDILELQVAYALIFPAQHRIHEGSEVVLQKKLTRLWHPSLGPVTFWPTRPTSTLPFAKGTSVESCSFPLAFTFPLCIWGNLCRWKWDCTSWRLQSQGIETAAWTFFWKETLSGVRLRHSLFVEGH